MTRLWLSRYRPANSRIYYLHSPVSEGRRIMSEVTVFNQQIRLLLDAGIPIVIGQAMTPHAIRRYINSIDAHIVNLKAPLENPADSINPPSVDELEMLQAAKLDPSYCKAFDRWRKTRGSAESFDCFYELGVAKRKSRWSIADAVLPSLILALVLLPASYFLFFRVYPDIESMYTISNVKPSFAVKQLLALRGPSSQVIFWCIPTILLVAAIVYVRVPNVLLRLFPSYRRYSTSIHQLQDHQDTPSDFSNTFSKLAWENRVQHEDNMTVRWFPVVVSTIVCGFVVAFYAILLFWPLAHLLEQLSIQSGVVS
ncbi:MAG: hypothetical protein ACK56W_26065 [Pirellula sp.]